MARTKSLSPTKSTSPKKSPIKKTGLGKGGAIKHKKVIKDSIQGVRPGLKRIWAKLKEKNDKRMKKDTNPLADMRISKLFWDELLIVMNTDFVDIVKKSNIYREHDKRKTIMATDVEKATGKIISGEDNVMAKAPFVRYIREKLQEESADVRLAEEAAKMLQAYYEQVVIDYLLGSYDVTIAKKQKTLMPSDLETLKRVKSHVCH